MINQLNFYFHQGRTAIAKSILTLLAIGLGVSLISGVNFYIDSYQTDALENSFNNMYDFAVEKNEISEPSVSFLNTEKKQQLETLLEDNNLTPENLFPMIRYYCYRIAAFTTEGEEWSPYFHFSDENFFQSSSFQDFFVIRTGEIPQSDNSIIIYEDFANYLNISVGDTFAIHFNASNHQEQIYNDTFDSCLNLTIAGTYLPKMQEFSMGDSHHYFDAYYDQNSNLKNPDEDGFSLYDGAMIFGYIQNTSTGYNFSHHPFFTLQNYWKNQNNLLYPEIRLTTDKFKVGLYGRLDKTKISYQNVISYQREVERNLDLFLQGYRTFATENGNPRFNLFLIDTLNNFTDEILAMRIILQIFNIPIILSALYIGVFSVRLNTEERQREFILLRSKGIPRKMIRRQFLMQSLMIGIITGILGIFGGIGLFYILRPLFHVFFQSNSINTIPLHVTPFSIIYTVTAGIVLLVVSSIPSIRFINKKETNQLLSTLGADSLDVEYDERTLFQKRAKYGIELEDTPFLRKESSNTDNSDNSDNSDNLGNSGNSGNSGHPENPGKNQNKNKSFLKTARIIRINKRRNRTKVYQNKIHKKEKKIRKIGVYFVIFSILPLFAFLLIKLSQLPFAPNGLILFVENKLVPSLSVFYVFSVLSPVFLVLGLIRFSTKENPSRFARFINKIAYPFVKRKNFLVSLQMVKQKSYIKFMLICGLFCSLLVFSNITLNSLRNYQIIKNNLRTGGDINYQLHDSRYFDNLSTPFSLNEVLSRENQLIQQKDNLNQSYINNATTFLKFETETFTSKYSKKITCFVDVLKYFSAITEGGKKVPIKGFSQKIENIKEYFKDPNQPYPGIVLSPDALEYFDCKVGDVIYFPFYYFDSTIDQAKTRILTVKVVESITYLPGLSEEYYYFYNGFNIMAMLNLSSFPFDIAPESFEFYPSYEGFSASTSQTYEIRQILDVRSDLIYNESKLESLLSNIPYEWYRFSYYQLYKPEVDSSLNYQLETTNENMILYFYEIINIEFIVIGGILAITLALITVGIQRQHKFENGVFLSRGMGWKGLLKLILTQISIVFIIALGFGTIGGFISGFMMMKLYQQTEIVIPNLDVPIFANGWDIFWMLLSITGLTFIVYLISFYFETKRNIREYLPEF